jgi:hypothetical protein
LKSSERLWFRQGFRFFFHHGKDRKDQDESPKTRWLMEEYTRVACLEDGFARADGKKVLPALYRMYLTRRDPGKEKNRNKKRDRDVDGEEKDGEMALAGW